MAAFESFRQRSDVIWLYFTKGHFGYCVETDGLKQWDQLGGCWIIHGGGAVDVTCTRDRNNKSGWVLNNNVNRADRLGCELWEKEKSPGELQDFFIKV